MIAIAFTAASASPTPADTRLEVDWPELLSRSDLVWTKGEDWRSAPFVGNGILGAVITQEGELQFKTFTSATEPVVVLEVTAEGGEHATIRWQPDTPETTEIVNGTSLYRRLINDTTYAPNPELAVAWREKQENQTCDPPRRPAGKMIGNSDITFTPP